MQTRSYDNNQGQRVYVTEVMAESVQFLEPKNANAGGQQSQGASNFGGPSNDRGFGQQNQNRSYGSDNGYGQQQQQRIQNAITSTMTRLQMMARRSTFLMTICHSKQLK